MLQHFWTWIDLLPHCHRTHSCRTFTAPDTHTHTHTVWMRSGNPHWSKNKDFKPIITNTCVKHCFNNRILGCEKGKWPERSWWRTSSLSGSSPWMRGNVVAVALFSSRWRWWAWSEIYTCGQLWSGPFLRGRRGWLRLLGGIGNTLGYLPAWAVFFRGLWTSLVLRLPRPVRGFAFSSWWIPVAFCLFEFLRLCDTSVSLK